MGFWGVFEVQGWSKRRWDASSKGLALEGVFLWLNDAYLFSLIYLSGHNLSGRGAGRWQMASSPCDPHATAASFLPLHPRRASAGLLLTRTRPGGKHRQPTCWRLPVPNVAFVGRFRPEWTKALKPATVDKIRKMCQS